MNAKTLVGLISLAFSTSALAQTPAPFQHPDSSAQLARAKYSSETEKQALAGFLTGKEFCEKFSAVTSTENGFYIDVPVDYSRPERAKTQIWVFLPSGPFDAKKPTFLFFDGGPGGNSHGNGQYLKNFNEVHYDGRGIGCSHPAKFSDYRNPNFYSNLNNVRDAEEIRKALGAKQISVYGTSYGTLPATMYASLFPASTKAVVLDGVFFSVDQGLNYGIVGYNMRKVYQRLPDSTKQAMLTYFNSPALSRGLFSVMQMDMYYNDSLTKFEEMLLQTFPSPEKIDTAAADALFKSSAVDDKFFDDSLSAIESLNNLMLVCRMSTHGKKYAVPIFGRFLGQTFEFAMDPNGDDETSSCDALGAREDTSIYTANQYPVSVPVTYFQGNLDGFTFAGGALRHYKTVPTGQKQLFIAKRGGHGVATKQLFDSKSPALQNAMITVVENALNGQLATPEMLKAINEGNGQVEWIRTDRKAL